MRARRRGRPAAALAAVLAASLATAALLAGGPAGPRDRPCGRVSTTDFRCHAERYRTIVGRDGVPAAFAELRRRQRTDGFTRNHCHYLAHVIGQTAAARRRRAVDAFAQGDELCSAGYYHGVMATAVERTGADRLAARASGLCRVLRVRGRHSKEHRNCAHGLGHGFMAALRHELPDALAACDALDDSWERRTCYSGAFMENVMSADGPGRPSRHLRAGRPLYPCTVVAERHKDACYRNQAAYALATLGDDFDRAFRLCGRIRDGHRSACYEGLGASAAAHGIRTLPGAEQRVASTRQLCMLGDTSRARRSAVLGAVKTFVHYFSDLRPAMRFCRSLPEGARRPCLREARTHYAATAPAPGPRRSPAGDRRPAA